MKTEILLGDEAVALGAVHAGVTGAYSYPGTPASEIMEYLIKVRERYPNLKAAWSVNEKVAYEEALGVSFAGKRAMVSMKHVGLNVAADPFMNSAITGTNGGLVVVAADDPGMHSSQNEQDSRYYARFARIPCLEPSTHQEAYDMTREAFDISEVHGVPVMIRLVTRLSHSRSLVNPREPREENGLRYGASEDWTLLPSNARRRFKRLLDQQAEFARLSADSAFNALELNLRNRTLGVIASGIAHNYVQENFHDLNEAPSLLKICTYPVAETLVRKLVEHVDEVLVVEEGYPLIEETLKGVYGIPGRKLRGKLTGDLPLMGELSPEAVRSALGLRALPKMSLGGFKLASRPPQLCQGCPHADTLTALTKVLKDYDGGNVFSDIGCYTLGAYPPYSAIQTCVCMGASVSMARGGADAGVHPSVAVIGDSTFGHSGLTPLLEAAAHDTNMTVIILDNSTVAMTGGQPSYASGERLLRMIEGLGVPKDHLRVIEPLPKNLEKNARVMREEFEHRGLSVIVAVRECLEEAKKKRRRG
jgi:indolepyruvate ferredoxin oxidoreductase, alpha subunit